MHTLLFHCGHLERSPTLAAVNVTDALARIAALYHIETGIRNDSADYRRTVILSRKSPLSHAKKANT